MIDINKLRKDKRPQSSTVVHALLDCLEAAEKERDHEKWLRERAEDYSKAVEDQRDALRAKIEAMERQEPAYWGPKHAIEGGSTTVIVGKFPVNPTDAPLYALPGAKGEDK